MNNSLKLIVAAALFSTLLNAQQSHIDSTFGINGSIFTGLDTSALFSCAPLIQSDGKIVLAGTNGTGYVARYLQDGTLDSTFGFNGVFESSEFMFLSDIIELSSGKLLLGGAKSNPNWMYGTGHDGLIMRLTSNGTIDSTFGASGTAGVLLEYGASTSSERVTSLEELPSGNILAYGTAREYAFGTWGSMDMPAGFIARYNMDGAVDSTFGGSYWGSTGCELYTFYQEGLAGISDVLRYNSERYLLGSADYRSSSTSAWWFSSSVAHQNLTRQKVDTSGALINSFNASGNIMKSSRIKLQNNKLLCLGFRSIGYSNNNGFASGNSQNPYQLSNTFNLLRYELDGSIDSTFGTDTMTLGANVVYHAQTIIDSNTIGTDMWVLPNDHIIVIGVSTPLGDSISRTTIARYTPDGQLDSCGFDPVYFGLPAGHTSQEYVERTPSIVSVDGNRILVATVTESGGSYGFQLARYFIYPTTSLEDAVCDEYTFNNQSYTTSGLYIDTLTSSAGCDSIIELDLTIYPAQSSELEEQACSEFIFNGNTYTTTGNYQDTLQSIHGCDSIIELNLTIYPLQNSEVIDEVCSEYVFNGNSYSNTGVYYDTLQSIHGCDSIIELDLTINSSEAQIMQNWDSLISVNTGNSYQWIDCATGMALNGETSASFTPDSNGYYGLVMTENGCVDTSDCFAIANVGIHQTDMPQVSFYPNPSSGTFIVKSAANSSVEIKLYTITGELVDSSTINGKNQQVFTTDLSDGVYIISAKSESFEYLERMIIHH